MSHTSAPVQSVTTLRDMPNVGPAFEADFILLGIHTPQELVGRDAFELYDRLCQVTGQHQDPCVLDVFMATIDFACGAPAAPWHAYTPERKRLVFLREAGALSVRHNSDEDLMPHLLGTRDLLRDWGARQELCDAGLFHSLYGTEYFDTATLPETGRKDVRRVIGVEAEHLVWLWCSGIRNTMLPGLRGEEAAGIQDWRSESWLPLDGSVADDLLNLWIADTLEQLPRVWQREVPTARMLLPLAHRALPGARRAIEGALERFGSQPG